MALSYCDINTAYNHDLNKQINDYEKSFVTNKSLFFNNINDQRRKTLNGDEISNYYPMVTAQGKMADKINYNTNNISGTSIKDLQNRAVNDYYRLSDNDTFFSSVDSGDNSSFDLSKMHSEQDVESSVSSKCKHCKINKKKHYHEPNKNRHEPNKTIELPQQNNVQFNANQILSLLKMNHQENTKNITQYFDLNKIKELFLMILIGVIIILILDCFLRKKSRY